MRPPPILASTRKRSTRSWYDTGVVGGSAPVTRGEAALFPIIIEKRRCWNAPSLSANSADAVQHLSPRSLQRNLQRQCAVGVGRAAQARVVGAYHRRDPVEHAFLHRSTVDEMARSPRRQSASAKPVLKQGASRHTQFQTRPFFSLCSSSSASSRAWGILKLVCRSCSTACAKSARPRCAARSRMPSVPVTRRPFH